MTSPSGRIEIDALCSGSSWNGYASNSVSYTFNVEERAWNGAAVSVLTSAQAAIVRNAMAYIAGVTGISFLETSSSAAGVWFGAFQLGAGLYAESSGEGGPGGVVFNRFNFALVLHEMGHILGLKHPFDGGTTLPSGLDSQSNTIMSYNGDYSATTYAPYDLYALTWIYGGDGIGGRYGENSTEGSFLPDAIAPASYIDISANQPFVAEGDSEVQVLSFSVTRSGDSSSTATISWSATGADASDFEGGAFPSGLVSFAAGETSRTISVNMLGDRLVEMDEIVTVRLFNPIGRGVQFLTEADESASVVVLDDDATASVTIKGEGQGIEGDRGSSQGFRTRKS